MDKMAMAQPGETIKFDGKNWLVVSVDLQNDVYTLASAINLHSQQMREVTAEQLFGEAAARIKEAMDKQINDMFSSFSGKTMRDWMMDLVSLEATSCVPPGLVGPDSDIKHVIPPYDARNDPGCDGWHVIWESTRDIPEDDYDAVIGELPRVRMPMPCESLDGCWVAVDYINDDELGEPVSIKCDNVKHYVRWEGKWYKMRAEDPAVPQGYC